MNKAYLTIYLAKFKLETESARSYLGYLWWFIDPLINAMIYFLLFSVIMQRGGPDFIYFLFLGVFLWRWMDNTIAKASSGIISQANLLKKLYVNKEVLVYSEVLTVLSKFIVVFGVVYIVYVIKFGFNLSHLLLPVVMLAHLIFSIGLGSFLGAIIPIVPDVRLIYSHGMRLLFYPSGILFSISKLPEELQFYVGLNPLVGLFASYRNILIYNDKIYWSSIGVIFSVGMVFWLVGRMIIAKYDRVYAKFLY
jgi:lipopolysaccharide transport system permease protein